MNYLKEAISFLKRHNVPDPDISATALLSYVLKKSELSLKSDPDMGLTHDQEQQFELLLIKRATRYPLQYLIRYIPFRQAVLEIGEGCLIPRPETELLIDVVLARLSRQSEPLKILDLGTGSGNIAVSLALERPNWMITATDVSETALRYAQNNSVSNHVDRQIRFMKCDLLDGLEESFDAVISNPPYVRTQDLLNAQPELSFEPETALDGGEDGLSFYRRIMKQVSSVLKPGGLILFEIGHDQAVDVSDLMKSEFEKIETVRDYAGHDRIISGFMKRVILNATVLRAEGPGGKDLRLADSSPDRPSGTGEPSSHPPLGQPAGFALRMTENQHG